MNTSCPICLEPFTENDNTLCMPVCMHKIHTKCELSAAQYDTRCPLCRTTDDDILLRPDAENITHEIYSSIEHLVNEHEEEVVRYKRKRNRTIKKNSRLNTMNEKLKKEKKSFNIKEKELVTEWTSIQKEIWMKHPQIMKLKLERKKIQRKKSALCKKLEQEVEEIVGPKPNEFTLNINVLN